jgi:hypothetical protein
MEKNFKDKNFAKMKNITKLGKDIYIQKMKVKVEYQ